MINLLVLDTSTERAALGLNYVGLEFLAHDERARAPARARPDSALAELLIRGGLRRSDLELIGVGLGPGLLHRACGWA